jgi:hypothetical protein
MYIHISKISHVLLGTIHKTFSSMMTGFDYLVVWDMMMSLFPCTFLKAKLSFVLEIG